MRRKGKPIIIECQSGTGKTTTIKTIIQELDDGIETEYLTARRPQDISKIETIVRERTSGRFVIDDFHRLDTSLQERIADTAKQSAEADNSDYPTKLIIIGINKTGSDLIQMVPDIAKRTGIHRILPGRKEDIVKLIEAGEDLLNIEFTQKEAFFEESRGDYWLTQQLCQSACIQADILETMSEKTDVAFDLKTVRDSVIRKLDGAYRPIIKEFCRGKRFRPSNDPYFKILHLVGQQDSSIIDLNDLANNNPDVKGSINNIKDYRLQTLLDTKSALSAQFYYNSETKSFVIEDPALFYYIKNVNWDEIRDECGFRDDNGGFEFDIAISFAGENRPLAEKISEMLRSLDVTVFYDQDYEAKYLGKDWTKEFARIFGEASRYVVCLLDKHHAEKQWPTFERDHFIPRVPTETVIPIFLDETRFLGIPRNIVGIPFKVAPDDPEWSQKIVDGIILKLIDRIDA